MIIKKQISFTDGSLEIFHWNTDTIKDLKSWYRQKRPDKVISRIDDYTEPKQTFTVSEEEYQRSDEVLGPKIKAECMRRINAVAPDTAQSNMIGAMAAISAKDPADRTDEDKYFMYWFVESLKWIDGMRNTYKDMRAKKDLDYTNDNKWPVCPDEVAIIADQF